MGTTLPTERGGTGYDSVTYALVVEEPAVGLVVVLSAINVHITTATLIDEFGNTYLAEEYLADMAAFDVVCAFGRGR